MAIQDLMNNPQFEGNAALADPPPPPNLLPILQNTADYVLYVGQATDADLPAEVRRMYFIAHKSTGVIHGRGSHLSAMIHALYEFQELLDWAIKNPKNPKPSRAESQMQALRLLGMDPDRGKMQ